MNSSRNTKGQRVADLWQQQEFMTAMRKVVDDMAADWPHYVDQFLTTWESSAKSVSSVADQLQQHQGVVIEERDWKGLFAPYETLQILIYARAMDHLSADETDRYLAACEQLDAAWQKFFASCRGRHPQGASVFDRLETARHAVHNAVVPLFTGDAMPVLTSAWAKAYTTLTEGYGELTEVLAI